MPWVAAGIAVSGLISGGLSAWGASESADAAVEAAKITAEAQLQAARDTNKTNREIEKERNETQQKMARLQADLANRQLDQAERQMIRTELRSLASSAGMDTFNKVAGAFTTFVQVQNADEEKRSLEMFGLEDRADLQPSPVVSSPYELTHSDLLTGETRGEDYRLSSDLRELEGINQDRDELLGEASQIVHDTEES